MLISKVRLALAASLATFALAACSGNEGTAPATGTEASKAALGTEAPAAPGTEQGSADWKAKREAMKTKMFDMGDKNGDGLLDETEVGAKHWSHLKAADANNDGKVSREELAQAHKENKLGHAGKFMGKHHRGQMPSPEEMIKRFDKNGDGVLDTSEMPERMQKRFESLDTDKDGKVSASELSARAKAHIAR